MRFAITPTLLISALSLFGLAVPAYARRLPQVSRTTKAGRDVLASRQYHIKRATIDTCVSVSGAVVGSLALVDIVDPEILDLGVCVCLSDLALYLDTDVNAQILAEIIGRENLEVVLDLLLNTDGTQCTLPDHAERLCEIGEPCAFSCTDGYTQVGDECICELPSIECNGVCGDFPNGCSSSGSRRRSLPASKITTFAQAQRICKHKAVCGIAGREDTLEFDCVDTTSALDSCGGCVVPHPFKDASRTAPMGVECNRLFGAITTSCSQSKCVVHKCRAGLFPVADATSCAAKRSAEGPLRFNRRDARAVKPTAELLSKLEDITKGVKLLTTHKILPTNVYPATLVLGVVAADANLLTSPTVAAVLVNLDAVINANAALHGAIKDLAAAHDLVVDVGILSYLLNDLHLWLLTNPIAVIVPVDLTTSPVPVPNTSDAILELDVDALVADVVALINADVDADIVAAIVALVDADVDTGVVAVVVALIDAGVSTDVVADVVAIIHADVDTDVLVAIVAAAVTVLDANPDALIDIAL